MTCASDPAAQPERLEMPQTLLTAEKLEKELPKVVVDP